MSSSAELLKPLPAPAPADRAAPRNAEHAPRETVRGERGERFEDQLSKERTDRPSQTGEAPETRRAQSTDQASATRTETEAVESDDLPHTEASPDTATPSTALENGESAEVPADPLAEMLLHTTGADSLAVDVSDVPADSAPLIDTTPTMMAMAGPVAATNMEPGALGRWFMHATSPATSKAGPDLAVQVSGQADQLSAVQKNLAAMAENADGVDVAGTTSKTLSGAQDAPATFAQALTERGITNGGGNQTFENLITQAAAQAAAHTSSQTSANTTDVSEATTLLSGPTAGQTLATGAQSAVTAVPQSAAGQAVPVTALAVEISRQAMNGNTKFDIRLDPPELGRLNVRLEMDATGQTRTHMIVERSETLEMLLTDARSLERALQQAGLKADPGSVSFELAGDGADSFADGFAGNDAQADGDAQDQPGTEGAGTPDGLSPNEDAVLASDAVRQTLSITGQLDVRV